MTIDMVLNICFVFLIGNLFGVLAASNIGYVLAHFFAITGVHPASARPTELAAPDQPLAALGADRLRARGDRRDVHDRRRGMVPDLRGRLRRHEGEAHRVLGARALDPALLLPAARPGQGAGKFREDAPRCRSAGSGPCSRRQPARCSELIRERESTEAESRPRGSPPAAGQILKARGQSTPGPLLLGASSALCLDPRPLVPKVFVRAEVRLRDPGLSPWYRRSRAAVPRPPPARPRRRRREGRPHRHRHAQRLRPPDALRPRRGLPAGHDQEGAPAVDHPRAALVPARRDQRRATCRSTASRSGTSGPTTRASSARSTATSGARGRRPTGAHVDQIAQGASSRSAANPDSRRLIVSAWNVGATSTRWRCRRATRSSSSTCAGRRRLLRCQLYQRSADVFLGVPFNIACYALLTMMVAQVTRPRSPATSCTRSATRTSTRTTSSRRRCSSPARPAPLPTMRLNPAVRDIFAFASRTSTLEGYDPHPAIKAPIAV